MDFDAGFALLADPCAVVDVADAPAVVAAACDDIDIEKGFDNVGRLRARHAARALLPDGVARRSAGRTALMRKDKDLKRSNEPDADHAALAY